MAEILRIALDAGHGSQTAGKRTPDGYREHWINVKCAYYCELALKRCGFEVVRIAWDDTDATDDTDVALSTRQNQIKNAGCVASASFHANAYGSGASFNSAKGVETLIHNNSSYVKDSRALALKVQARLVEGTAQSDRGVKPQELAMCNCVKCGTKASILVEIGFMTNKAEADLMRTDAFCKEQAEEVAHGFCDYFGVAYKKGTTSEYKPDNKPAPAPAAPVQDVTSLSGKLQVIYKGVDGLNVRTKPIVEDKYVDHVVFGGTFTVVGITTDKKWYLLKSGLYISSNSKYVKFTETATFKPYSVKVSIKDLNIRTSPSAKTSSNKLGKYTGKGVFTIVEEATGPVNSSGKTGKWGLLKSYKDKRNGWICLDVDGVDKV